MKMSWIGKSFLLFSVLLMSACNPVKLLHKEIKKLGYIPFPSPMKHSGPGTMIGGSAKRLQLVAPPETCFPSEVDGMPTNLIRTDDTVVPQKNIRLTAKGKGAVKLLRLIQIGNAAIDVGAGFENVSTLSVNLEGVHIEYLDSIALVGFYKNLMSEVCKDFLDRVGFIIQAIRADKVSFEFYQKNGAHFNIDLNNIDQFVDVGAEAEFEIENDVTLNVDHPTYLGYQLGRLLRTDDGISINRASRLRFGKFKFESLDLFQDERDAISGAQADEPSFSSFSIETGENELDTNSIMP